MKHIVQLSGGKDSTAMLLMMLERGMPVDEILFCDTGVEFPAMALHLHLALFGVIQPLNMHLKKLA